MLLDEVVENLRDASETYMCIFYWNEPSDMTNWTISKLLRDLQLKAAPQQYQLQ